MNRSSSFHFPCGVCPDHKSFELQKAGLAFYATATLRESIPNFAWCTRLTAFSSEYRRWWWANPLGMGLIFYGGYKAWHMIYMVRKQKKSEQNDNLSPAITNARECTAKQKRLEFIR